jgi:6-bladed beta-propeller
MASEAMTYQVVAGWEQLPEGYAHRDVVDVDIDSSGRIFLFGRGDHPVMIYEPDGSFVSSWGDGVFTSPHGMTIGPDDAVYCVDNGDHSLRKFTPDGELLMTLGTPGVPSDAGASGGGSILDPRLPASEKHVGGPFKSPTKACVLSSGEIYVSDGYGNARIHVFSPDGELERSWGSPGDGEGEFNLPHWIEATPDEQRLFVCDRENSRIQIFDLEGNFLEQWTDLARPDGVAFDADGNVYVAELGGYAGRMPFLPELDAQTPVSCVSIWTPDGQLLTRWGSADNDFCAPGSLFAAHGIAVDANGDVFVGEVTYSGGANNGVVPADCHTFQKFTRA